MAPFVDWGLGCTDAHQRAWTTIQIHVGLDRQSSRTRHNA